MRVSDLGTSFDAASRSPRENLRIAGAVDYAPLDRRYSHTSPSHDERIATDVYLLGSLIFFFFSGISATQAIVTKLKSLRLESSLSCENFEKDLPFIEIAFNDAIEELVSCVNERIPSLTSEIRNIAVTMCHPDPKRRGLASQRKNGRNPFDMYRIVSSLDLIARKAEVLIK